MSSLHGGRSTLPTGVSSPAGVLDGGEDVALTAESDAGLLLLAARPIGEPVVQYGPFVMNTREEIEQALRDYQAGTLAGEARAGL